MLGPKLVSADPDRCRMRFVGGVGPQADRVAVAGASAADRAGLSGGRREDAADGSRGQAGRLAGGWSASGGCGSPNDLQLWKLLKEREVESGLGQEAVEEAWPVLHLPEPGFHQRGQLADVVLDQVGQRSFQVGPDRFSRFAIVHGSLDRRV